MSKYVRPIALEVVDIHPMYLNSANAAKFLGYTPQTLGLSRHEGTLGGVESPKFTKRGRQIFYKLSTLEAWAEQFPEHHHTTEALYEMDQIK